jgi:hypothetical protein
MTAHSSSKSNSSYKGDKYTRASRQYSPISSFEHMPTVLDANYSHNQLTTDEIELTPLNIKNAQNGNLNSVIQNGASVTWRSDIKRIMGDYSTINSVSYRVSTAIVRKALANAAAAAQAKEAAETAAAAGSKNGGTNTAENSKSHHGKEKEDSLNNSANMKEGKSNKINNVYVIKPSAASNSTTNGSNNHNKENYASDKSNLSSFNEQTKYDIYMVPGSLVNGNRKNKK